MCKEDLLDGTWTDMLLDMHNKLFIFMLWNKFFFRQDQGWRSGHLLHFS